MLAGQGYPDFSFCENAGFLPAHHTLSLKSVIFSLKSHFFGHNFARISHFFGLKQLAREKTAVM